MFREIAKIIKDKNCTSRFLIEHGSEEELTEWGQYFNFPTDGYIEIPVIGPIRETQIKWIEIDTVEEIIIGRLVPPKYNNHMNSITRELQDNDIDYSVKDSIIKVYPQ